jgi:hypothetical protein
MSFSAKEKAFLICFCVCLGLLLVVISSRQIVLQRERRVRDASDFLVTPPMSVKALNSTFTAQESCEIGRQCDWQREKGCRTADGKLLICHPEGKWQDLFLEGWNGRNTKQSTQRFEDPFLIDGCKAGGYCTNGDCIVTAPDKRTRFRCVNHQYRFVDRE